MVVRLSAAICGPERATTRAVRSLEVRANGEADDG